MSSYHNSAGRIGSNSEINQLVRKAITLAPEFYQRLRDSYGRPPDGLHIGKKTGKPFFIYATIWKNDSLLVTAQGEDCVGASLMVSDCGYPASTAFPNLTSGYAKMMSSRLELNNANLDEKLENALHHVSVKALENGIFRFPALHVVPRADNQPSIIFVGNGYRAQTISADIRKMIYFDDEGRLPSGVAEYFCRIYG